MSHIDKQHAVKQERGSHTTSSHAKHKDLYTINISKCRKYTIRKHHDEAN